MNIIKRPDGQSVEVRDIIHTPYFDPIHLKLVVQQCIKILDGVIEKMLILGECYNRSHIQPPRHRPIGIGIKGLLDIFKERFNHDEIFDVQDLTVTDTEPKKKHGKTKPKRRMSAKNFKIANNRPREKYARNRDKRR